MLNAEAPSVSEAVTLIETAPTKLSGALPLKVCVRLLKLTQLGSALPSARDAE